VRLLGTALVVIPDSTDFRDKGPEWVHCATHCHRIEVDYQSGSKQPHSKGCRHIKWLIVFSFNLHMLQIIPSRSSNPSATLAFWSAWLAAPLSRLSNAETMIACPVDSSTTHPTSQKGVLATNLISGI
jgi:hypothetical protein